ncbi:MAG: hypothetical protein EBU81_15555 [Proteobacteria bacterium]|nr:hypothetical protein [Pseudomonadota bacterium]
MPATPEVPIPNKPISALEKAAADLLGPQELEVIDACILSHCTDRFLKVARVILRTENELQHRFPKLTHIFYTQRLRHLVDTRHFQAAGDVVQMRFSEVQLPR